MDIAKGGCESECAGKIRVRGNKSYKGIASGHKDAGWVVEVKYKVLLLNVPGWECEGGSERAFSLIRTKF